RIWMQVPARAAQPGSGGSAQASRQQELSEPRFETYEVEAPKAVWREPGKVGRLLGGVVIKHGDTVIKAQEAYYNRTQGTASASGGITVADPETTITAEHLAVDLNARKAVLEGGVRIVYKPKPKEPPSGRQEKQAGLREKIREEAVITCARLEYYYRQKRAVATGSVKFMQGKRLLTADTCMFFQKQQVAVLVGSVSGEDEKGQTYTANALKLVLKEGDEYVEAERFRGVFKVEAREEEEVQPPELSPSGAQTGTSSG
ncbi:MAG: LptA/OstA family protein, partial [Armatimonadota bacterium]